jgi:polysaccharide export outer membrane protein
MQNVSYLFLSINNQEPEIGCFLFLLLAWFISFKSFPIIINISKEKNLVASPTHRSSHSLITPNLGGVGIFIGFIISFTTFGAFIPSFNGFTIIGPLIILFFLGLNDDIIELSANKKFIMQLIVTMIIINTSNLTVNNLYGFLNIYQIDKPEAVLLTSFVFVFVINAYNLIDGIDGLAGIIAFCFLLFSATISYVVKDNMLFLMSLSLLGSIVAFLQYNFSKKNKIFMGDTGSMIVGFLIAFIMISLLKHKAIVLSNHLFKINPVLMLSLFFYPLIDTTRIFFIRIFVFKKSPFIADRHHLHHRLLDLKFKHWQISAFVGINTILLATTTWFTNNLNIHNQILITLLLGTLLFSIPQILKRIKNLNSDFIKKGALLIVVSVTLLFLQSCTTKKDLLYFQTGKKNAIDDNRILDQKIETNDILSIKILSLDIESSRIYNMELLSGNANNAGGPEIIKLNGYLVNDEGFITLPVLGQLKVNDKTTRELEQFLSKKLMADGHLKEPTVTVRLVNSKLTVLGEVRVPGTFTFYEKNLTLLQAIGMAGDLTINGERKDVLLIRYENNTKTINHIDLTSTDWMSSNLFYVKQNDVIIVNPNNAKIKSAGIIGNAGTLISVFTLLLTGFLLIKN